MSDEVTLRIAAKLLGCSVSTLRKWVYQARDDARGPLLGALRRDFAGHWWVLRERIVEMKAARPDKYC